MDGISLKMHLITVAGFIAWLAYGMGLLGRTTGVANWPEYDRVP